MFNSHLRRFVPTIIRRLAPAVITSFCQSNLSRNRTLERLEDRSLMATGMTWDAGPEMPGTCGVMEVTPIAAQSPVVAGAFGVRNAVNVGAASSPETSLLTTTVEAHLQMENSLDVDGSGSVNLLDLVAVARHLNNVYPGKAAHAVSKVWSGESCLQRSP